MSNRFTGKTALITGAGSGIGKETALRMAKEGAHVLVFDMNGEAAESVLTEIKRHGGQGETYVCDISNHQHCQDIVAGILQQRSIEILVNNAGIAHIGNLQNTTEADLDKLYQVNVKGVYNMMLAVVPSMKEKKYGAILNLASVASSVGIADRFAYSMTKGAVLTMTYSVAKDYINDGIRCNCIAPGRVHTPFVDQFLDKNYPDNRDEMFDKLSKSQPIGRMGKVEEVAGLICFLCSDDAAFMTGTNVPVDGGFVTLNN